MTSQVFVNRIATAVPDTECHAEFSEVVPKLIADSRTRRLFGRFVAKSTIESRYTFLRPAEDPNRMEADDFYRYDRFPTTAERMQAYEKFAYRLAERALNRLELNGQKADVTHLIVASCTGFYAPGLDIEIMKRFGLSLDVERTFIGFMGCFAGINALKTAYHIVRSDPKAKVLTVNLELCTLHFQAPEDLEQLLSYIIFSDGCAATLVSAERYWDWAAAFAGHTSGENLHLEWSVPQCRCREKPRCDRRAAYH